MSAMVDRLVRKTEYKLHEDLVASVGLLLQRFFDDDLLQYAERAADLEAFFRNVD